MPKINKIPAVLLNSEDNERRIRDAIRLENSEIFIGKVKFSFNPKHYNYYR